MDSSTEKIQKHMSRAQFLALVGGATATFAFAKVAEAKDSIVGSPRTRSNGYGNSTYGGKATS